MGYDSHELRLRQDAFVLVALHAGQAVVGPAVLAATGSWLRMVDLKGGGSSGAYIFFCRWALVAGASSDSNGASQ
jgi:hypothetical protein